VDALRTAENPTRDDDLLNQLCVVVVMHNSAAAIEGCLRALPAEAEIVVVDNSSADEGLDRANAVRADAMLIQSEFNRGFGGGCNLGWRSTTRPYVAFINPDVRVQPNALPRLIRRLLREQHSMVGPRLLEDSGAPRPCKARPAPALDFLGLLPAAARWAPTGWNGKLAAAHPVHQCGGPVASVEGACFLIRRSDLESIGGFDEDFFLYYEEDSLALRLSGLGGGAVYEPGAVAIHSGADSTRQTPHVATRHMHRSRVIFYRKRDGNLRGGLAGLLLALGLGVAAMAGFVNASLRPQRRPPVVDPATAICGVISGMLARINQISYPDRRTASDRPTSPRLSQTHLGR
jgi:hypothetical protein